MSELPAISELSSAQDFPLNSLIALLVALTATFMALCNVKDGNVVQAMQQAQAGSIDTWSMYQAKSTKQYLAEATLDELTTQRELLPSGTPPHISAMLDKRIADYSGRVKRYGQEKGEIKKQAEDFQKQYDALNLHDDQFDLADAALSVAIALFGITALTKKRWLLLVAIVFMGFGLFIGVAGFLNWSVHPDGLARLLS